jgi:glutathione S-transferase
MNLTLFYHPLASFCHKVQIALHEAGTPFTPQIVDLMDPGEHARFLDLWPIGKMPVLHDAERGETVPETSIIIEYLDQHYPGTQRLLPQDRGTCLTARLWDRFFDLYVQEPMQKIVLDTFRPQGQKDTLGVAAAEQRLELAYSMIEQHMQGRTWVAGDAFSIADCAAAPALFYAGIIVPFGFNQTALRAYFERLLARPSFRRVIVEAQPYFDNFPFRARMPEHFLTMTHD